MIWERPSTLSGTMYLALLTLTLLGCLTIARRLVEPSCPGCAAKQWVDQPPHLECARCGWSNLATVAAPIQVERFPGR